MIDQVWCRRFDNIPARSTFDHERGELLKHIMRNKRVEEKSIIWQALSHIVIGAVRVGYAIEVKSRARVRTSVN